MSDIEENINKKDSIEKIEKNMSFISEALINRYQLVLNIENNLSEISSEFLKRERENISIIIGLPENTKTISDLPLSFLNKLEDYLFNIREEIEESSIHLAEKYISEFIKILEKGVYKFIKTDETWDIEKEDSDKIVLVFIDRGKGREHMGNEIDDMFPDYVKSFLDDFVSKIIEKQEV